MKKKIVSFILAMATLLSLFAIPHAATGTFVDVSTSHWAYSYIQQAFEDGAINGTSYNEQTGVRTFSPDANVTWAQVIAVLTRAFYADEVAASTATGAWWAKNEEVAKRHKLLTRWTLGNELYVDEAPIFRASVAEILCRLLDDHGVKLYSTMHPEEQMEFQGEDAVFTDWAYHGSAGIAISDIAHMGIMGGYPDGSFKPNGNMTRAEFSAIYVRAKNLIDEHRQAQAERPIPYGPVGTMSDFDVELSMATHYAGDTVPDYWSEQTDAVKAIFATEDLRAALNAYIHTALNAQTILTEGRPEATSENGVVRNIANDFYNYPVFKELGVDEYLALPDAENYKTAYKFYNYAATAVKVWPSHKDGQSFYTPYIFDYSDYQPEFRNIVARFSPGMSSREKIKIMLDAMDDRWDYDLNAGGSASWFSNHPTGECVSLSNAAKPLFGYAGIPTLARWSEKANHAVNICFLPDEGKWIVVDVSKYVAYNKSHGGYVAEGDTYACYEAEGYVMAPGESVWTPTLRAVADVIDYIYQHNPWLYSYPSTYYENLIPN